MQFTLTNIKKLFDKLNGQPISILIFDSAPHPPKQLNSAWLPTRMHIAQQAWALSAWRIGAAQTLAAMIRGQVFCTDVEGH